MADPDSPVEQKAIDHHVSPKASVRGAATRARREIQARCAAANLKCEDVVGLDSKPFFRVGLGCGHDVRWIRLDNGERLIAFAGMEFEKWKFLPGYNAVYSHQEGAVEALVLFAAPSVTDSMAQFRKAFAPALIVPRVPWDLSSIKLVLSPPQKGLPAVEISPPSELFKRLTFPSFGALTIKLTSCSFSAHDQASRLLVKLAGSLLFQIDLLSEVALTLAREPRRLTKRSQAAPRDLAGDLQYPRHELDDAPASLYRYGRGAAGMPLLQFFAYYQAIEFYFPVYSKAEAQRRLKAVLKDPMFRGDRDADIGKLLSSIYISRSGAYGDERSQLRATLAECLDAGDLRVFLESESGRRDFYSDKGKSTYHRLSLENPSTDLRSEVADRIYDIRCKIVHTKADSRKEDADLLLPFSKEAEDLFYDVQLVRYVAQRVLIAASAPL